MTPQAIAEAIMAGADRTKCDLRSALDLPDSTFDALQSLARGEKQRPTDLLDRYEGARLRFYSDGLEPVDGIVDAFDGHWFHLNDCWSHDGRDVGTVDVLASRVYAIQWAEEDGGLPAVIVSAS